MNRKNFGMVLWAVAGLLVLGLGTAQAVEVKLSGQINRAIMWADNGNESEILHVDNDNSSTRFRLVGAEQAFSAPDAGAHSTQSTDRGGKPAGDGEFSFAALLEWLTGQRD